MDETQISNSSIVFRKAKDLIGKHLTLNPQVPAELGCAEAVSFVLLQCKVKNLPFLGFASTAELLHWLETSPQFVEIFEYEPGAIIISATGTGNGLIHGHTGILGNTSIMSNNSDNGLWQEKWNIEKWNAYYQEYGKIPTRFFRMIII